MAISATTGNRQTDKQRQLIHHPRQTWQRLIICVYKVQVKVIYVNEHVTASTSKWQRLQSNLEVRPCLAATHRRELVQRESENAWNCFLVTNNTPTCKWTVNDGSITYQTQHINKSINQSYQS